MTDERTRVSGERRFTVHMLGGLRLHDASHPRLRVTSRKARALLAYLVLPAGRRHRRDELAALLWPTAPQRRARASLRRALSDLREHLGSALRSEADEVCLQAESFETDVERFMRATAVEHIDQLDRALEHYRGHFLERLSVDSEPFTRWQLLQRQHLHSRMMVCVACRDALARAARRSPRRVVELSHAC